MCNNVENSNSDKYIIGRVFFPDIIPLCLMLLLMLSSSVSWSANFTRQGTGASVDSAKLFSIHEIVLTTGDGSVANPFDTNVTVTFKSPGKSITVNSFYDGGNTWRARTYIDVTGSWSWTSRSSDPGLNGKNGSFSAIDSSLSGKLRKHSRNLQQWMGDNKQPIMAMSDTPYLLFNDACLSNFNSVCNENLFHRYVEQISVKGINLLRVGLGGGYSRWVPGARASNGRYPRANWIHDGLNYSRFDLKQLQKTDERLTWLLDNYPGIYVTSHLLPKNNTPGDRWYSDLNAAQRHRTIKYLVARYAAWPQLLFLIERDVLHTCAGSGKPPVGCVDQNASTRNNLKLSREVGACIAQKNVQNDSCNSTTDVISDPWGTMLGSSEKPREPNLLTTPSDFSIWSTFLEVQSLGGIDGSAVDEYYGPANGLAQYPPVHVVHGEDIYENPHFSPDNDRYIKDPGYYYRRIFWSVLLSGGTPTYGSKYKSLIPYNETGSTPYFYEESAATNSGQLVGLDTVKPIRDFFTSKNLDLADFSADDNCARLTNPASYGPQADNGPSRVQCIHNDIQAFILYHPNALSPNESGDGEKSSSSIHDIASVKGKEQFDSRRFASLNKQSTPGLQVDLRLATGITYNVKWFHPIEGIEYDGGQIIGGKWTRFIPPAAFLGTDAVLYLEGINVIPPVLAHRGGGQLSANINEGWAPENTMAAFRKAIASGINMETDLNFTSDGEIILLHGSDLSITTDCTGAPTSRTLAFISRTANGGSGCDAAANGGRASEYSFEPVPVFSTLLDEFKTSAKPGTVIVADTHLLFNRVIMVDRLLQALEQTAMFDRVHLQVYTLEQAELLRAKAVELFGNYNMLKLAIWVNRDTQLLNDAVASGYIMEIHANASIVSQAAGLSDNIRYVGQDANWQNTNVDAIGTNLPDVFIGNYYGDIPDVVIAEPLNNAKVNTGDITVKADYGDSDKSIIRVEFFQGSQSIGVDDTPPYQITWRSVASGNYSLSAVITDEVAGVVKTKTSASVNITVGTPTTTPIPIPPIVPPIVPPVEPPVTQPPVTAEKTLTESFTNNATADRLISNSGSGNNRERIVYSDSTGFGWGAYNAETAGTGALIVMRDDDDIRIKDTTRNSTNANRPNTYLYTLFSSGAANADLTPTDPIDLSGTNAAITIETTVTAPGQQLRLLLRDSNDDWYLSDNAVSVARNTIQRYDISGFTWQKVAAAITADMNALDNGGEAMMVTEADANPDFSEVTGGGFYIQQGFSAITDELRILSIAWSGNEVTTTPPVVNPPVNIPKAIAESFTNNSTADRLISNSGAGNARERIVYSDDTGFGWGAYNAEAAGTGALIVMRDNDDIRIKDTTRNSTNANRPGTYVYTLFSANAASGNLVPTETINLSGSNAAITLETTVTAPGQQLRLLLRDRNNDWYLSNDAVGVARNATQSYDISGFSWQKVAENVAAEMSELDNGGELEMVTGTDANPDFRVVTGGGFYIQQGFSAITDELRIRSFAWSGTEVAVTPLALQLSGPIVINGEQDVVISGLRISNPFGSLYQY